MSNRAIFNRTIDLYVDNYRNKPVIVQAVEGQPVPPLMLEKYREKLENAQVIERQAPTKPASKKKED